MKRHMWVAALATVVVAAMSCTDRSTNPVVIGSKDDTEGVILGDVGALAVEADGVQAEHRSALGGTRILWEALLRGDIDAYPEYTGTLLKEIFSERAGMRAQDLDSVLQELGVGVTEPFGFNNTYVLGVTQELAASRGLSTVSDLRAHPDLRFGFSNEFMDRGDGWPALKVAYDLAPAVARGLDHALGYRALAAGSIDVIDLYSTDPEIAFYDLVTLEDDRQHFPEYAGLFVYRLDLAERAPVAVAVLRSLAGTIDEADMISMNAKVRLDGIPSAQVAGQFLAGLGIQVVEHQNASRLERIAGHTADHLVLVLISMVLALATALPLGIVASRRRKAGGIILGVVGAIYTIPALALLVFMIPLLGIGAAPAIVALFLYSLLPIVRNTHAGLTGIARPLRESAEALGLSRRTILRRIELPLASPLIMAGIKTAVVINIGTATLGALIGAGGLGQPILTGIRLADTGLILEGAIPAALLALGAQALFDALEHWVVPRGLRL